MSDCSGNFLQSFSSSKVRDVISASKATRAGGGVLHLPIRVLGARAPILILKSVQLLKCRLLHRQVGLA